MLFNKTSTANRYFENKMFVSKTYKKSIFSINNSIGNKEIIKSVLIIQL